MAHGIFLDQGLNPCLLHWQEDTFTTEPPGKPLGSSCLGSFMPLESDVSRGSSHLKAGKSWGLRYLTWLAVDAAVSLELSSVQSLSCVRLFATPWTAARQASLSIANSQSLLKLNVHRVTDAMQPFHPLLSPFSCLQSFPASGSFPMSQLFTSGGQTVGASASVLPMNIQD